jgi:hypothetical protein
MMGLANIYSQAASGFIQQIRQYSPPAAGCLEKIQSLYGSYAAFLAAFALVILQDRHNRPRSPSSYDALKTFLYYEEMREKPEAINLYKEAADYLFSE